MPPLAWGEPATSRAAGRGRAICVTTFSWPAEAERANARVVAKSPRIDNSRIRDLLDFVQMTAAVETLTCKERWPQWSGFGAYAYDLEVASA